MMIGFIAGALVFLIAVFLNSYRLTLKRCAAYIYLECLKIDFSNPRDPRELTNGEVEGLNKYVGNLKWQGKAEVCDIMNLTVRKYFDDNNDKFLKFARSMGFKG